MGCAVASSGDIARIKGSCSLFSSCNLPRMYFCLSFSGVEFIWQFYHRACPLSRHSHPQRRCSRTNSQPAPSQRSQVPARVNPVAEQAGHSFQLVFRISRPFVPAHRFPPTILPHSPLIRVASYDSAPHFVHRATGFGLLLIPYPSASPFCGCTPRLHPSVSLRECRRCSLDWLLRRSQRDQSCTDDDERSHAPQNSALVRLLEYHHRHNSGVSETRPCREGD